MTLTTQKPSPPKSRGLHSVLKLRGAPRTWEPTKDSRFVGAREGLRVYVDCNERDTWTYYVLGPADVLLAFNGFSNEASAANHGVGTLTKLADRVLV